MAHPPRARRGWRVVFTPGGRDAEKARSVVRAYNESIQDCRPVGDVRGSRRVLEALLVTLMALHGQPDPAQP